MDIEVAEALGLPMMRINSILNDSVALVRDKCSAEDLQWYRREVGKVMGALCLDIDEKLGGAPVSSTARIRSGLCGRSLQLWTQVLHLGIELTAKRVVPRRHFARPDHREA